MTDTNPLREALSFYADDANWRQNGPLDPNSANFTGGPARAALAAAPQPAPTIVDVDMASGPDFTSEYVVMRPSPTDREMLAWVVADKNGTLSLRRVRCSRAAAERATWVGERVVRVAIRVVEGGDNA